MQYPVVGTHVRAGDVRLAVRERLGLTSTNRRFATRTLLIMAETGEELHDDRLLIPNACVLIKRAPLYRPRRTTVVLTHPPILDP